MDSSKGKLAFFKTLQTSFLQPKPAVFAGQVLLVGDERNIQRPTIGYSKTAIWKKRLQFLKGHFFKLYLNAIELLYIVYG